MRRSLVLVVMCLASFGAACGGDDAADPVETTSAPGATAIDAASEGEATDVVVVGQYTAFSKSSYEATAGEISFAYENLDNLPHTLLVEGREDDMSVRVDVAGDRAVGSIDLEPGEYTLYCDIEGHREAGMIAPLTVS